MTARKMLLKFVIFGVVFMPFLTQAEANVAACSPSNTNIVIDARVPGEITTPEFPDGSPDTSCTWKIQAQENSRLEITIKDLKLPGVDKYLIIRDGAEEGSPLIGKYGPCASGSLTLFSTGNSAFLQLVSSAFTVNYKLRIAFKPIDSDDIVCSNGENPPNLCGLNTYLRESSGVVSSPNFPNNYGASKNCLWTIVAPPGYRVHFTIHWLGIEDHRYSRPGSCGDDSISVSEYRGNYTRDVAVLCGCKRLFTFVSFMDKMWVRFSSYKRNNWPGFYATYKTLAPEECPAGETNCSLTSTNVAGFDAQGQVCRISEKTTTKVTKQGTPSLLSSSVNTLARLRRLTSTPALEINTTAHPTFSESYRWHLNTSSPQKTIAIEIKTQAFSSLIVLATSILPRLNASAEKVVPSSEVMKPTSVSLMRLNTLELATSVTSSSSFPNQNHIQASSFVTVEDNSGIRSPIGQIKIRRDVFTSSYVLGTNKTTPVVLGSSLAQAQHVITTRKPENVSSEGISMKPSIASEETASGLQTTPVERPTTQHVPITGTENPLIGLEVKCTHYVMELTISRFLRPNLVISSLHLQDPTCKVSFVNDTHAFLNAPLDGCGTQQRTSEKYFIYINTMTGDEKSSKSRAEITRKGRLKFEFKCSFKKLQVLSIVSYSPRQKGVRIADDGVGNFTFEMDMFKDPEYDIVVNQYPVTVQPGQLMYFKVNVKSRDRRLLTFLEECWVTPTPDPSDKTKHILIKQGCSRDSSLQYVYKKSSLQKFTFKAFRFRYVVSERLYVHCKVVTCRMSDVGSVCDRGCKEDRRQRRENTKLIMDKDVFLSLGPVTFQDQGEESQKPSVYVKALPWALSALALILVIAVIVLILRRRNLRPTGTKNWISLATREYSVQEGKQKDELQTSQ